jgi:hypothetical protein
LKRGAGQAHVANAKPILQRLKPGCVAEFVSRLKPRPTKIAQVGIPNLAGIAKSNGGDSDSSLRRFFILVAVLELVPKVLVVDFVVVLHFGGFDEGTE